MSSKNNKILLCDESEFNEKSYQTFRTLRSAFTMFVFFILIITGFITGSVILLLYHFRAAPIALFTPVVLPLLTMSMSIFIGTFLAAFVGKVIINPLRRLIAATDEIRHGNYSIRVDNKTSIGELNNLMISFNSMAKELGNTELFRNNFINNFSHEFKTPVVSVRGFARQLQKDNKMHHLTDEQRREYTDIIVAECDRLANLSTNILTLTKFENQQIVTDKTDFYLDEQIRSSILLLEKQWSAKNIDFELNLSEIKYHFNEEMLSQVWINLIGNAIKFSPENETITVRCIKRDHKIQIDISDNGEGMDSETIKKIFDKFYQSDTSHKSEGNGLGLSIVKRIIELAGGEITVVSEPKKGSTFKVYLPLENN